MVPDLLEAQFSMIPGSIKGEINRSRKHFQATQIEQKNIFLLFPWKILKIAFCECF